MRSAASRTTLLTIVAGCLLAACNRGPSEPVAPPEPQSGPWQATITLPGGEIETAFELSLGDTGYQASLVNGQERVRIDDVRFGDGELVLHFPVYNNEIRARYENGTLQGELTLIKRYGETQVLPFDAQPGTDHGHDKTTEVASVDMSGRWSARFYDEDGDSKPSIGEFAQRGSRLFGTFVNIDGDHRYLAGHVSGNHFTLSTFDGAHAFLFSGTVDGDTITGAEFWSGNHWHQTWTAERDANATLPDAYSRTRLKEGYERLTFEFPDHENNAVSLDDEKFAGQVVLIALSGSWCPNCNDEARFLTALHNDHHEQGLRVIALMFEHFDDQAAAVAQVEKFRAKHAIEYDTLIAGVSDKALASEELPALDAVLAFPTTIFVDRNGSVRTIHTGFSGPGTGEYHEQLKSEFSALVSELLAEEFEVVEDLAEETEQSK